MYQKEGRGHNVLYALGSVFRLSAHWHGTAELWMRRRERAAAASPQVETVRDGGGGTEGGEAAVIGKSG